MFWENQVVWLLQRQLCRILWVKNLRGASQEPTCLLEIVPASLTPVVDLHSCRLCYPTACKYIAVAQGISPSLPRVTGIA